MHNDVLSNVYVRFWETPRDSSKPLTGYDGKTVAEDIYQSVSQLGFRTIFLVGHDIGTQVAYSYAAAHPTEVKRLVVMDFAAALLKQ